MRSIPKEKVSDHLSELRNRLLISFFAFAVFSVVSYLNNEVLIEFLLKPFDNSIYFTSPSGGFSLLINTSFLFGFLFSLPIIIYELFAFLAPIFSKNSFYLLFKIALSSSILMLIGVLFAYLICLPAAFYFLSGFESEKIQSLVNSTEYFSFVSRYLIGFGLIFQLPLMILLINLINPIKVKFLLKLLPYVILFSFIISAILTPTPDPINQSIMAIPIILLYMFSILILFFSKKA